MRNSSPLQMVLLITTLVFFGAVSNSAILVAGDLLAGDLHASETKQRKKKKSRRSKTSGTEDSGSGSSTASPPEPESSVVAPSPGAAPGKTMHKAQEGVDKPYKWHAALTSSFGKNESQTGESKTGTGNYDLHLLAAYIINASIEAGPEINYRETTTKFEDGDPAVNSGYDIGVRLSYNIGSLDKDVFVPFVQLGFALSSATSKAAGIESSASGTKFSLGGGVHYFVDSNVAFTADLAYRSGSMKAKGASEETKTTELDFLNLGFSLFL